MSDNPYRRLERQYHEKCDEFWMAFKKNLQLTDENERLKEDLKKANDRTMMENAFHCGYISAMESVMNRVEKHLFKEAVK